jgi:HPt (histidine-containing phosphotransfer) domain-containing protein
MTGNAFSGDREKCLSAGMDDYICKPIRLADLQAALERWGSGRVSSSDTAYLRQQRALAAEDLMDYSILDELSEMPNEGGSMFEELLELFLEGVPKKLGEMKVAGNDAPKVASVAHALKSMSMHLGAKRMTALCEQLEQAGRNGNVAASLGLVQDLEVAYARTRVRLLAYKAQEQPARSAAS